MKAIFLSYRKNTLPLLALSFIFFLSLPIQLQAQDSGQTPPPLSCPAGSVPNSDQTGCVKEENKDSGESPEDIRSKIEAALGIEIIAKSLNKLPDDSYEIMDTDEFIGEIITAKGEIDLDVSSVEGISDRIQYIFYSNNRKIGVGTEIKIKLPDGKSNISFCVEDVQSELKACVSEKINVLAPIALDTSSSENNLLPKAIIENALKSYSDTDKKAGELIKFFSASQDEDGSIVKTIWTVGGRVISREKEAELRFPEGENEITLKVIDDKGGASSQTLRFIVQSAQILFLSAASTEDVFEVTSSLVHGNVELFSGQINSSYSINLALYAEDSIGLSSVKLYWDKKLIESVNLNDSVSLAYKYSINNIQAGIYEYKVIIQNKLEEKYERIILVTISQSLEEAIKQNEIKTPALKGQPNKEDSSILLSWPTVKGYSYNLYNCMDNIIDLCVIAEKFTEADGEDISYTFFPPNLETYYYLKLEACSDAYCSKLSNTVRHYSGEKDKIPEVISEAQGVTITTDGKSSKTSIAIGVAGNGEQNNDKSFTTSDFIDLVAKVIPDPLDVGKEGEIYVVVRVIENGKKVFLALNEDGYWETWNASLKSLPAARYVAALSDAEEVLVFSGELSEGERLVYVGYSLYEKDGKPKIHVSLKPYTLTVKGG